MTKSEITDLIIGSFVLGAMAYNLVCMLYYYFKQRRLIYHSGPITKSNIEARDKLRRKLQTHGLMACSMLLLALYMRFAFSWFWFLTFSLIGSFFIHNWLSNIFGNIIEYSSLPKIEKCGLYLRSFTTDIDKQKHKVEILIAKKFAAICRLFSIGNPYEIFNIQGATTIYATDQDWKNVITDMMAKSSYIILRLHHSEGTLWELDTCFTNGHAHKTIFILDNAESFQQLSDWIWKYYQIEINPSDSAQYPCAIPFSNISNEVDAVIPLNSSSSIRALASFCISSNVELQKEEARRRNNRSNILKRLFRKEYIPAGIGCIDLGFFLNPYLYVLYNRWPLWLVLSPLAAEGLALFINKYYLYSAPWIPFATMFLWVYCLSLFFIMSFFPKRISWLSRNWPSVEFFKYESFLIRSSAKVMTLSMMWYFFWIYVLIYIFTGWTIQLK